MAVLEFQERRDGSRPFRAFHKQIPNESGPQHLVVHNNCFGQAALEDHGYSVQNNLPGTDYLQGSACFADFRPSETPSTWSMLEPCQCLPMLTCAENASSTFRNVTCSGNKRFLMQ